MKNSPAILVFVCFVSLFLCCYAPAIFQGRQFGFRDAGHFYYPLHERVQKEWNQGRWPLWEPEENAGMPLLGNPAAAVLYPGKLVFALLPYPVAVRHICALAHSARVRRNAGAFAIVGNKLAGIGPGRTELRFRRADLVPVLQCDLPRRRSLATPGDARR